MLDTAKFEHMWRVATAIAASSPVPESLRKDGTNDLPQNVVIANCFKVVNQAVRWNMDPFALIDCASIIKGRLCWEGKVIAAVLESVAGIELDYTYEGTGELMKVKVIGTLPDGRTKEVEGDVGQWKTTRTGSPWSSPKDYKRQLAYRGAREWARRHKPAVMLGVYGSDEITPTGDVIDITPSPKPPAAPPPRRGGATQVRRVAHAPAQEQPIPETVVRAQKTPVGNAEPSPPQHSKPLPVKGKATKMTQFDWNSVEDLDEKQWLKDFKVDLDECRNKMMINAIVDRRQGDARPLMRSWQEAFQ